MTPKTYKLHHQPGVYTLVRSQRAPRAGVLLLLGYKGMGRENASGPNGGLLKSTEVSETKKLRLGKAAWVLI